MKQDSEFSQTPEYKEMTANFNKFYENQLSQIAKETDDKHLESIQSPQNQPSNIPNSKPIETLSNQWQNIDKQEQKNNDTDDMEYNSMDNCSHSQRIIFILNLFDKLVMKYLNDSQSKHDTTMEFTNIFMSMLSEKHNYFIHNFLNDFEYLKKEHLQKNPSNYQHLTTCKIDNNVDLCAHDLIIQFRDNRVSSIKKYVENQYKSFMDYLQTLDHQQMAILHIVSKTHFIINHQILISDEDNIEDSKEEARDKKMIRSRQIGGNDGDEQKFNKFINEVIDDKTIKKETDGCLRDSLFDNLLKSGIKREEAAALIKYIIDNDYDTDAIGADAVDCNNGDPFLRYHQSNIMKQLPQNTNKYYLMRTIKNVLNVDGNDNDSVPPFQFGGGVFRHTQYYHRYERYIKAPKYASLKHELLHNTIFPIDADVYSGLYQKASIYHNTNYVRNMRALDSGIDNNRDEIPVNLPMTISHLLVLMSYTNHTKLQYYYKKHACKRSHPRQTLGELKQQHTEIANWYRLLFETIMYYGDRCQAGDVFFTGMTIRLSFHTFIPKFYSPLSTSSQYSVAHRFSKGKGLILQLKALPSCRDRNMSVESFSNYPDEKEHLFLVSTGLEIINIHYFDTVKVYGSTKWLNAFKLLSGIFGANYMFVPSHIKKLKAAQKNLLKLIQVYKLYNNIDYDNSRNDIEINLYIQQMFYTLLHNIKDIKFIKSQYQLLNDNLRKELLQITDLLRSLKLQSIVIFEEFHWIFSDQELEKLKQAKSDQYVKRNEKWKYKSSNISVTFGAEICRKGGGSSNAGFKLRIHESSRALVTGEYSIMVDEIQYTKNNWAFNRLSKGGYHGFYFFNDDLIDTLQSLSMHIAIKFY